MPKTKTGLVFNEEDEGLINLFGCTGQAPDGSRCPAWIRIWFPKGILTGTTFLVQLTRLQGSVHRVKSQWMEDDSSNRSR